MIHRFQKSLLCSENLLLIRWEVEKIKMILMQAAGHRHKLLQKPDGQTELERKRVHHLSQESLQVSKVIFFLKKIKSCTKTQNLFHRSRLCRIVRAKSMKEILKLCDGFVPGSTPQVLFWIRYLVCLDLSRCSLTEIHTSFQRFSTSTGFDAIGIHPVFREGEMHVCENNCALTVEDEIEFWALDDTLLQVFTHQDLLTSYLHLNIHSFIWSFQCF